MSLTCAYITNRHEPHVEWFLESLFRQVRHPQRVLIVDFYGRKWSHPGLDVVCVEPMPSVWCGPHRLTKENWFNPSSFRNTALCHCPNDFISWTDDVSVLLPGWYDRVLEAEKGQYVVCGTYSKVKKLVVEDGIVKSFEPFAADNRLAHASRSSCVKVGGGWLYGCSVAGPVSAFLKVNGWPETLCGGTGFEDVPMGCLLTNAGIEIRFDPQMATIESEEHHHNGTVFIRRDKGVSPMDKSHGILKKAQQSQHLDNASWPMGIAALREMILRGEPYPTLAGPSTDWWDGQKISEME